MPDMRFLQIHFLVPYAAALLNRDDAGLAKRLPYGGSLRTRISSQCLKRHWRLADDPHSLRSIDGIDVSYRSREIVERKILGSWTAGTDMDIVGEIKDAFLQAIYGDKGINKKSRQTLILGDAEVNYLIQSAKNLVKDADGDRSKAKELVSTWLKEHKKNLKVMGAGAQLPGGLAAALFGRMMTSDPQANIDAPIHVAHAFTVHAEEAESDYFVAADDLAEDSETGADTIQETELNSGLFYGYVVVDLPGLVSNLGSDYELAGAVLHNLIYLIAEVSPGAKLGSTAPYSRASFMLLEAGDRQPRSLAEAFKKPCRPHADDATSVLSCYLKSLDDAYATGEERIVMSLSSEGPDCRCGNLADLAAFAKTLPRQMAKADNT